MLGKVKVLQISVTTEGWRVLVGNAAGLIRSVAPRERTGATTELPTTKIKRPKGANHRDQLGKWLDAAPIVRARWDTLRHTYECSLHDVAALRLYAQAFPEGAAIRAAGLPWFMAVFGVAGSLSGFLIRCRESTAAAANCRYISRVTDRSVKP